MMVILTMIVMHYEKHINVSKLIQVVLKASLTCKFKYSFYERLSKKGVGLGGGGV